MGSAGSRVRKIYSLGKPASLSFFEGMLSLSEIKIDLVNDHRITIMTKTQNDSPLGTEILKNITLLGRGHW